MRLEDDRWICCARSRSTQDTALFLRWTHAEFRVREDMRSSTRLALLPQSISQDTRARVLSLSPSSWQFSLPDLYLPASLDLARNPFGCRSYPGRCGVFRDRSQKGMITIVTGIAKGQTIQSQNGRIHQIVPMIPDLRDASCEGHPNATPNWTAYPNKNLMN